MKTILIQGGKLYNGLGDPVKKNPGLIIKNGIFQQVGIEENESHQLLSDPKVIKKLVIIRYTLKTLQACLCCLNIRDCRIISL